MPSLSIIILNWNTADLLENCLLSLQNHLTIPAEIIVVDNASSDSSCEMVRTKFPGITLLPQTTNGGFAQGNNVGLAIAQGEYLLLLNPDTEIRPGGLEQLIQFMETNPKVGIAGPRLWNPDGSIQQSTDELPSLTSEFFRYTMLFRLRPNPHQKASFQNNPQQVGMVTGAALCIRRACYAQIGGLDEQIFMFYEDTDWCKRAWDAGWPVWFVPTAGVMHIKAAASSRFARSRTLLDSQRGAIYYFTKHFGPPVLPRFRLITACGAMLRFFRAGVEWLLGRNRPDQMQRLTAYFYICKWAITGKGL